MIARDSGFDDAPLTAPAPAAFGAKPFSMADVAAAALARPRTVEPWAERDDLAECPLSPSSCGTSSPFPSLPNSPFSDATSCAMTPSSSAGSFCLPPPAAHPPIPSFASSGSTLAHSSSAPALSTILPPRPPPKPPVAAPLLPRTVSVPSLGPVVSTDPWHGVDFSLKLLFTAGNAPTPNSHTAPASDEPEHTLPPAFFPSQRISFSPRLRIASQAGLAFSSLGGMHLGVTGMCETLDGEGNVKSKRMIADFCIDLSSGLRIWKRDADTARKAAAQKLGRVDLEDDGETRLPPGTYVLPLSMKVPNSDRLPPSFECAQFRISYTMSIALFSAVKNANGTPRRLKVFSVPFHVLPSTLPAPAPELPVLTHEYRKGVFASLMQTLTLSSPKPNDTGYHIVHPSLPTSHFSPGAHASIPVSLRIVDRPLEPTDLYIRLALVRKTYVRESSQGSLAQAIEDEWGLGPGASLAALGYPEEVIVEPWCKEEEEIVSRWGWIPYSSRPGADPTEKAEVVIRDIALPLHGADGRGWTHGYSTSLDLEPTSVPSTTHGECSWFSPAFRGRPPVAKEYGKHVHVSTRFFLSIEVGFATPALRDTLDALHSQSPDLELPRPNAFTAPASPRASVYSGQSTSNPFHVPASRSRPAAGSMPTPAGALPFPGKLRELLIPVTIGSVAEPGLACLSGEGGETAQRRQEREAREERGEDARALHGEGPEGAWLCAPPVYEEALRTAPAYV
ncbi:Proteophosphoglycan ppg4 [Rhodotorula diobovata]|uniref:Proteophosphoglycan ppg4 n=1 Tax=Rhodotorula diobovata TaxID=5288 RepID=A0A5C5FXN0_9BASI|nr:Proteophosphoglycan ppg4 [Rhodotorula diobovata]